jgi:flagellum-specific ATP synthase
VSIGDRCAIVARDGRRVPCEVVGFREGQAIAMPFSALDGVGLGSRVEVQDAEPVVHPDAGWLGRVVNALGEPIDDRGPLPQGVTAYPLRSPPPPAHRRQRVGDKVDLGVRAINTFVPCCHGQRLGIFSGSGVGKSTLLGMFARHTDAGVSVIGLVGERGREVREFIDDILGPEGLARSVLVVATSDEAPLMRRQAAYLTLAIAECLRDQGEHVLCMMDSVTRFAMAQREIGLAAGEPPTSKGYTPTVFAELPKLLERAGPGLRGSGAITGLFSVLVEGDDHNEPVADAVRATLDGHIVLDRHIAERGRFPAIDVLRSVSRAVPHCNTQWENAVTTRGRALLATYEDMAELIRIGAYRRGSDPRTDEAIDYYDKIEGFLSQSHETACDIASSFEQLGAVLHMDKPADAAAQADADGAAVPAPADAAGGEGDAA